MTGIFCSGMQSTCPLHWQVPNVPQVEYYFSPENLTKDFFLRQHMSAEGWVPLSFIANFKRVKMHTPDLAVIVSALSQSATIEMTPDGGLMRKREDWQKWVLPPAAPTPLSRWPPSSFLSFSLSLPLICLQVAYPPLLVCIWMCIQASWGHITILHHLWHVREGWQRPYRDLNIYLNPLYCTTFSSHYSKAILWLCE